MLACKLLGRELLQRFDCTAMKKSRIEALFDAWMGLAEAARVRLATESRETRDMACAVGALAVLDEAEFHLDNDTLAAFRDGLMASPGHDERAMTVFFDHPKLRRGATSFHRTDTLSYERKRKNLPRVAAAFASESLRSLEAAPSLLPPRQREPRLALPRRALPALRPRRPLRLSRGLRAAIGRVGGRRSLPAPPSSGVGVGVRLSAERGDTRWVRARCPEGGRAAALHLRGADPHVQGLVSLKSKACRKFARPLR